MIEVETEKRFNIVDKLFGFMSDVNNYDLEKMYDHEFTIKNEQGDTVTYGYDENGFGIKEPGNQSYNFLEMMGKAQMNKSKSEAQMAEDTLNFMSKPDKIERTAKGLWRGFAIGAKNTGDFIDLITGGLYSSSGIRQSAGSMSMENLPDRQEGALGMVSEIAGQYVPTGFGSYALAKKILPKGFATLGSWKNFGRILLAELGMEFTAGGTADPEATNIPAMLQMFGLADAEGQDVYNKIVDSLARDEDDTVFEAKYKDAFGNLPVAGFVEFIFPFYKSLYALKHNKPGRELFAKELGLEVVKDNGLEGVFKVTNKDGEVIASFDNEELANKLVQSLGEEFEVQSFKEGGASVVVPDNINKVPLDKLTKSEQPFYSNVVNAINKIDIPEQGMDKDQFYNTVINSSGVKQSELDDMGFKEFVYDERIPALGDAFTPEKITKKDVDAFLKKKSLTNKVNTKILGEKTDENNQLYYPDDQIEIPERLKGLDNLDDARIILDNDPVLYNQFNDWVDDYAEQNNLEDMLTRRNNEGLDSQEEEVLIRKFLKEEYDIGTFNPTSKTFYGSHTLPGGEDYKELLISSNGTAQVYRGDPHFSKTGAIPSGENLLAHVRFNTRTINGKKTLFIEELQSDLHQTGRREGYVLPQNELDNIRIRLDEIDNEIKKIMFADENIKEIQTLSSKEKELLNKLEIEKKELRTKQKGNLPNAPFKKNWHELAMKRIIKYAIDNDFEAISFTPGSVQVERYDLSKHLDKITIKKSERADGKILIESYTKDNSAMIHQHHIYPDQLEEFVGKELAEKIIKDLPKLNKMKNNTVEGLDYSEVDLKIGGEGMIGFYDKMLPSFINKFVKKYNTKLTNAKLTDVPVFEGGKYNYRNTKLKDAKNLNEMHDLVINDDYLNKEFMLYLRDELNELDPDSLIKNANQDEIKGYINEFLEDDYGLNPDQLWDTENIDLINAPFLEITPEMKMDIYEKGVPIAKVKKKKVNQQSTRMA